MSGKTACVAVAAGWVRAVQAEGRAVSLDVAQTLAMVTLLCFGGARQRALARLVVCRGNRSVLRTLVNFRRKYRLTWLLAYFTC